MEWGLPNKIVSDNGPQFRSEFKAFCQENDIKHVTSSPHNAKSNGLSESAVKQVKHLLQKCQENFEKFQEALLEYRNCPTATGYSPAQIFMGRRQRTALPALSQATMLDMATQKQGAQRRLEQQEVSRSYQDRNKVNLEPLKKGQEVIIQNHQSKRWEEHGKIKSANENGRSYEVELNNGKVITRNRIFLRPHCSILKPQQESQTVDILRRSPRLASKKSVRFQEI